MAIVSPISATAEDGEKGAKAYTAVYQVIDSVQFGGIAAKAYVGVNVYDTYAFGLASGYYEYDTIARAVRVAAVPQSDDALKWLVTIDYKTIELTDDNPLHAPWKVSASFDKQSVTADFDIYGAAILNRAGDPMNPGLTRNKSTCVIGIERNELDSGLQLSQYYVDKINLYPFFGAPKGCCLFRNRSVVQNFDAKYGYYFTVSYDLEFDLTGFSKIVLNNGLREKIFIRGNKWIRANCQIRGEDATSPVNLDLAGKAQGPNDVPTYLTWELNDYADFSIFGLE